MAIDEFVNIVYDNTQPVLVYSVITHLVVPDELLFHVFLMRARTVEEGYVGLIAGLDTAKFVAEKYHGQYHLQCAIVAKQGERTIYWPPLDSPAPPNPKPEAVLAENQREHVDTVFQQMATDKAYQEQAQRVVKEFEGSEEPID